MMTSYTTQHTTQCKPHKTRGKGGIAKNAFRVARQVGQKRRFKRAGDVGEA